MGSADQSHRRLLEILVLVLAGKSEGALELCGDRQYMPTHAEQGQVRFGCTYAFRAMQEFNTQPCHARRALFHFDTGEPRMQSSAICRRQATHAELCFTLTQASHGRRAPQSAASHARKALFY